jgi:plasmid stabilization system protein ParE
VTGEPRWHPAAVLDAEEARNWYAARSPLAARAFLRSLEAAIDAVAEAPARWPSASHGCRRYIFTNQFPFTLIYRDADPVQIVAVAHQKRRPGYWRKR